MSNARQGNVLFADSTGSLSDKATKVAHIIFTPGAIGDRVVIGSSVSSDPLLSLVASTENSAHFLFEKRPLFSPNGIYIQSIDAGASVIMITTTGGGD